MVGAIVAGDCDACAVVCMGCEYAERVRECKGDRNAGVGDGGGVVTVKCICVWLGAGWDGR